jgi:predicted acylesterase/phospholipase RssA
MTRHPLRDLVALLLCTLPVVVGCSHANVRLNPANVPVEARRPNATRAALAAHVNLRVERGQRSIEPTTRSPRPDTIDPNDDGYFVGLALSGGGSRSANFSAACMFELQRLGLLRRVDYISSVSGGSLTAAFYCTSDDRRWNPRTAQQRLTYSFASDVIRHLLLPWNAITQMFTSWDRTDLLAESFERELFSRNGTTLTYSHLRADRPRLLINATDLQSGRRFVFCNESFDRINSDLAKYPLARAVAASAAAPVLMHHVTLQDYSTTFDQYVHLIDGGVNDNLGIATLIETYYAHAESARQSGAPDPYPNGAIFVMLDARTQFDAQLSDKADMGLFAGLAAGAGLTSTALLNRVSSATMSDLIVRYCPDDTTAASIREQIKRLEDTGYLDTRDRTGRRVRVVHVALSYVNDVSDLPFTSFSERVNNIATYFNIDPTEAYHLYKAAELLVREKFDEPLREIVNDLDRAGATQPSQ